MFSDYEGVSKFFSYSSVCKADSSSTLEEQEPTALNQRFMLIYFTKTGAIPGEELGI